MTSSGVSRARVTFLGLIASCLWLALSAPASAQTPIWTWTNQRDQLLGQLSRLQFDDDLDRAVERLSRLPVALPASLAEPVAWNDIAAGTDAFSFEGATRRN